MSSQVRKQPGQRHGHLYLSVGRRCYLLYTLPVVRSRYLLVTMDTLVTMTADNIIIFTHTHAEVDPFIKENRTRNIHLLKVRRSLRRVLR